jgi:organic hydroperoxide reductase OsmC/OhrA
MSVASAKTANMTKETSTDHPFPPRQQKSATNEVTMSEHNAVIRWKRGDAVFTDNQYSRAHQWQFDGGAVVPASSSPHVVRVPLSDPAAVDPEEAYIASIASCHMLWFLSVAAAHGYVVDSYEDAAVGRMAQNERKVAWVSEVVLTPRIVYGGGKQPTPAQQDEMHHEAHEQCFIANSIKTAVIVR